MESFFVALNAVVPFLIYIAFGYFVRSIGMADEAFLKKMNQLVFKAFFPIMMFNNLYQIETGTEINMKLVAVGVASVLLVVAAAWLIIPKIVQEDPKRGVLIQGMYRSNFVLFVLPLTVSVFGEEYRAVPTIMIAVIVPLYNVLAVLILEAFSGGKVKPATLIKNVLTNPLIAGALVGLIFYAFQIKIPDCIHKPIQQFSNLCTPLGMFVLGGTLRFSSMYHNLKYLVPALAVKMLLIPAIVLIGAYQIDFLPVERFVLLAMHATPLAVSSYTMAQNMGGDGELAGELVVLSTTLSVITLFLWILILGNLGLLF